MSTSMLATTAAHRIFAWPRYESPRDLDQLASEFGKALCDRPAGEVCLCLRHDAAVDLPVDQAVQALQDAFTRALGDNAQIELLLVDDPLDDAGWAALGRAVTGVIALPSSSDPDRQPRLAQLGHPLLTSAADLGRAITIKPPRVTAIVSTYKSAVFMRGCLEDLVAQTLYARGELEILVIDSGSPENEGAIVAEMQRQHPAIRYVRTERETLYTSWNRAIPLARGAYLSNANTDDRHRPDALEIMANALDARPDVAVVYADSLITLQPNETWAHNTAQRSLDWPGFDYARLQRQCFIGPHPMWRKSLHDRWGGFDVNFIVAGDYEFWLRIGREEGFARLPEVLGLYYQNNAGLEWASGRTAAETQELQRRYAGAPALSLAQTALALPPAPPVTPAAPGSLSAGRDPLVSVIVPTFNRPDFLARALASLARQTFRDFEVLVVNDAGAPLEPVLARFADHLSIVYIRHGVNRDRAAARNTALRVARGKYIAYLDDDDCFRPDHLGTLVEALRPGTHKIAYSDAVWVLEQKANGAGPGGYQPTKIVIERSIGFDRDRLLCSNYIPILSVMHERACLDDVGAFDEQLGTHEDWELFIRLCERWDFHHVARVTADISYRPDASSTTGGKYPDFYRTMALIHDKHSRLVQGRPDLQARQADLRAQLQADVAKAEALTRRAGDVVKDVRALLARGEIQRASVAVTAAIELAAHSADLIIAIADVFAAQNQLSAACDALEQGGVLHPVNAAVPLRLAQLLIDAGDLPRARKPAQRAAALGDPAARQLVQRFGWTSAP